MKKKFLIIILAFTACKKPLTNQQKAERLVKLYLDSTLNDPKAYENIHFNKVDTLYSTYKDDIVWKKADVKKDSIQTAFNNWKAKNTDYSGSSLLSSARVDYFLKTTNQFNNDIIKQMKIAQNISKSYIPKIKGWEINDKYRAKNSFGALGIHYTEFYIDTMFTKVINSEDLDN